MKKKFNLSLDATPEPKPDIEISDTGTLRMDDVLINANGVRFVNNAPSTTQSAAHDIHSEFQSSVRLADLTVLQSLGRGAQGVVRLAKHNTTGTFYALKELRCNLTDKTVRKQFLRELHIISEISSPFIVPCYGVFFVEHAINIVTEFMDAGSLENITVGSGGALRHLSRSLLSALSHLEKYRLLHRDIKPTNLLASRDGSVKLADFGLTVKTRDGIASIASLGVGYNPGGYGGDTFVGSLAYMSPERITDGRCTFASDVWSAGLTLLEMAIGKYPYENTNQSKMIEMMDAIIAGPPSFSFEDTKLVDFLNRCFASHSQRCSATELLKHPWITAGDPARDKQDMIDFLSRVKR
ncbi:hypothetical protein RCL1_003415 [Eukaryota sp. TZLM3-RCL]